MSYWKQQTPVAKRMFICFGLLTLDSCRPRICGFCPSARDISEVAARESGRMGQPDSRDRRIFRTFDDNTLDRMEKPADFSVDA